MTFHVLWETCRTGVAGPAGEGDPGEWDSPKVLGLCLSPSLMVDGLVTSAGVVQSELDPGVNCSHVDDLVLFLYPIL